jgi:hypothetical protein
MLYQVFRLRCIGWPTSGLVLTVNHRSWAWETMLCFCVVSRHWIERSIICWGYSALAERPWTFLIQKFPAVLTQLTIHVGLMNRNFGVLSIYSLLKILLIKHFSQWHHFAKRPLFGKWILLCPRTNRWRTWSQLGLLDRVNLSHCPIVREQI